MSDHTHHFKRSNPTAAVEMCRCGVFRFTEHSAYLKSLAEVKAKPDETPRQTDRRRRRIFSRKNIEKILTERHATPEDRHAASGCVDYLQHSWENCPKRGEGGATDYLFEDHSE